MLRRGLQAVAQRLKERPCLADFLARWDASTERAEGVLERIRRKLRPAQDALHDDDDVEEEVDLTPRWGEPKEIRDMKRRTALKQALRRKVPRGFEEGV